MSDRKELFRFQMLRSHEHPGIAYNLMYDWRLRLRQVLVLLSSLCATAYFSHHAMKGRHGLEARSALLEQADLLEFEIRSLETVRARLRHDVALLTPDRPDPDLVEEIARDVLGYVHPADRVIVTR
jgi:cell division protein FtsB